MHLYCLLSSMLSQLRRLLPNVGDLATWTEINKQIHADHELIYV